VRTVLLFNLILLSLGCEGGIVAGNGGGAGAAGGGTAAGGGAGTGGGGSATGGGSGAGGGVAGDLPCDVATVLTSWCLTCHGATPSGGAPMSLVSRADLTAMSAQYPGQTIAQRCVARVSAQTAPMPPGAPNMVPAADVAVLQNWVNAGTPAGSCSSPDAGPFTTTCASGSYYVPNGDGSSVMDPGQACSACHKSQEPGRAYFFMGTVFPGYHEADLCDAPPVSGGTVEILDANGAIVYTLTPNSAGNFYQPSLAAGLALPYTARVNANGRTNTMTTPQTSGDCNTCHTEQGLNGAPGRIVWP
jgi:hypothetical protein